MEFSEYIIYLFNFSLGIAAVLAFIVIIAAGIKMVESRGNPSETQDAKQKIINSLIGLTVLLTSYILLTTINPDLVKIENISLGTTGITIPIITPGENPEKINNYQFEEIPIGTLTEAILIGTSSTKNEVPCYEYEHEAYDDDGQLIIANTVDKNKDGKIDKKDVILNKDMFYCIKLLDDAIKKKIEVHLNTLIAGEKQLDALMKSNCTCKRAYYSYLPPNTEEYKLGGTSCSKTGCYFGTTYCQCCGGAETGCSRLDPYNTSCDSSSKNPCEIVGYNNGKEVKQYQYDTCDNRLAINCKRQEIKQLMDGTKPDKICYEEVNGAPPLIEKEQPFNLFTIKQGIERLEEFKAYYDKQIKALEDAELKTKNPYGEKITLAELQNNIQTKEDVSVSVKEFDTDVYYNIARYCRTTNCVKSGFDPKLGYVCPEKDKEYELSFKKRVCNMEVTKKDVESGDVFAASCEKATGLFELDACREYYSYAGDPATFYYGKKYNSDYKGENELIDSGDEKCNLETQDIENEMYGGLIRIGETVDYSQAWGREVSRRISKLIEEVQGMYSTGMAVSNFPNSCSAGNCTNSSPNKLNICTDQKSVCNCKGDCCCAPVSGTSCQSCEPAETICKDPEEEKMDQMGHVSSCFEKLKQGYQGCSTCCGDVCPEVETPQSDYWTCPYRSFCNLMKDLYQRRSIQRSCLEETEDTNEEKSRTIMKSKVGYVQKMEMREVILFEMAQVKEIKDDVEYDVVPTTNLISLICPDYLRWELTELTCNAGLNKKISVEKRFDLFDMLKDSRERLNGCVKGYDIPYKDSADNVRILSCFEASNASDTGLNVIPEFPFLKLGEPVDKDIAAGTKYINCYPYNSNNLTDKEKEICFYNINRTGTDKDQGCLMITKNYMDNYYCCQ
ncbi:MAG: pilin [Candidatus Pacearchaeota archaeon]